MPQDSCVEPPANVGAYTAHLGCSGVGSASYVVGNLTSHRGPVMHSVTNYVIFWLPPGYHFDTPSIDNGYPNASDANYQALVGQYLRDLSNTAYYSIVQQYTDSSGAPGSTSFGGAWVDTSTYPDSEGTRANPLQDSDIMAEVARAMNLNGWPAGNGNNVFFVLTGQNVYGCAGSACSYNSYCAYHSAFQAADGQVVVYADVPDPGNGGNVGSCLATAASGFAAPNSGAFADSAVNLVAHEGFESVTDPVFNGWYYQDTDHEIGDECVWKFGSVSSDGSNILLNGHRYLLQEMWSNRVGGCFIPQAVSTLSVVASYKVQGGGSGFAPPTFTYYSAGVLVNKVLSATPQTLNVDFGTTWNVTGALPGSTSTERWQIGQATDGVLRFAGTFAFVYYHQYLMSFEYTVVGGGSGYPAPLLTTTQFGNQASLTAALGPGSGSWVDAQSRYSYTAQLSGSSSNERWMAQSESGTIGSPGSVSLQYYHQYLVPVSYAGEDAGSTPAFAYHSFGSALSAPLAQQPQNFWIDAGGAYSATNPLQGSTATERWFAAHGNGTISSATAVQLVYLHQYFVRVQGGSAPSRWFNSSAQSTISTAGVYARNLGAGLRVTGYQVDGGAYQAVAPTSGPVDVVLQMNGPHTLDFSTVTQFQVALDSGASASMLSMTPPTVAGDPYWYDSGSTVTLVLDGVWGRNLSSGNRLVSYSTDGGPQVALATASPVSVLSSVQVTSPHSVTTVVATQYVLSTVAGSIQSLTDPTIQGDVGWYDAGTRTTVSYNYVWNDGQDSRMNAVGVKVDGVEAGLARSGIGTFQESVVMDSAHALEIASVVQYRLSVSGGFAVALSPQSPTGDGFYDSGSSVSVSSARTWEVTGLIRQALISYNLDGQSNQTPPAVRSNDSTSLPSIWFDRPHQLVFGSATQYLVVFRFTDALGSRTIVPSAVRIGTSQPNATLDVEGSKAWVDAGATFTIKQLLWENADVSPLNGAISVGAPQNVTVPARVYDAVLGLSDYLQIPVSGATANIRLANGTSLTRTSGPDGTISLGPIPLGRFDATVTYLGVSQGISADVGAQQKEVSVKLPASGPDLGALAAGAAIAGLVAYAYVRRTRTK